MSAMKSERVDRSGGTKLSARNNKNIDGMLKRVKRRNTNGFSEMRYPDAVKCGGENALLDILEEPLGRKDPPDIRDLSLDLKGSHPGLPVLGVDKRQRHGLARN